MTTIPSERGARLDDFVGDRATSTTWLAQYRNHMRLNTARYSTEIEKVSVFLSYFKGPLAGKWAERRMKEYDADQDDATISPANKRWTTQTSIIDKFKLDYAAIDPTTAARTAIETIRQEKELASIDKFITTFDGYADDSEFDDSSLLYFFKRGLNPSLLDRISMSYPIPDTLATFKTRAVEMQHAYEARKAEKANWTQRAHSSPSIYAPRAPPQRAPAPAQDMGVPMDVDASRNPGASPNYPPLVRLTPMEREILRRKGACFRCRGPGHMSRDCPNRSGPSAPTPSRTIRAADTSAVNTAVPTSSDTVPASSADAIQQISNAANLLRGLQGDDKAQALAFLKDVAGLDF